MYAFWQCAIRVIQLVFMAILRSLSHFPVNFFGLKILTRFAMVKVVGEYHSTAKYLTLANLSFSILPFISHTSDLLRLRCGKEGARSRSIFKCQFLAMGLLFQGCFSASSHLSTVLLSHLFSERTGHSSHKKLIPNSLEAIMMIINLILLLSKIIKKNMSTLLKILQLSDFYMAAVIWYVF